MTKATNSTPTRSSQWEPYKLGKPVKNRPYPKPVERTLVIYSDVVTKGLIGGYVCENKLQISPYLNVPEIGRVLVNEPNIKQLEIEI